MQFKIKKVLLIMVKIKVRPTKNKKPRVLDITSLERLLEKVLLAK